MTATAATPSPIDPANDLGPLPEWNLADLYPGMESAELKRDLDLADSNAASFAESFKGKLADIVARGDAAALLKSVKDYESLSDLMGRIGSYAGLVYSGDTTDPKRAKFYGDIQSRLTNASTQLIFFELELNRLEDAALDVLVASDAGLSHYKPWFADIRLEKPYQLADDLEKLFHEKSQTGRSAWNRLFDETLAAMRFDVEGEELALEATLNRLQDPDEAKRKAAADALAATFKDNLRVITLVTNVLAKDKEISDTGVASRISPTAGISPIASSVRWLMRSSRPCAMPIRACRTAITP